MKVFAMIICAIAILILLIELFNCKTSGDKLITGVLIVFFGLLVVWIV